MSSVFRALSEYDLARSIEELLLPRLAEALRNRAPGHCMRVSDLNPDLIATLAKALRSLAKAANVHVLTDEAPTTDGDLYISSTKLVELRNPLRDGTLRPPLCVFLPANLRTSAEDSFGSATFEDFRSVMPTIRFGSGCWSASLPRCKATYVKFCSFWEHSTGAGRMRRPMPGTCCARMPTATTASHSALPCTKSD